MINCTKFFQLINEIESGETNVISCRHCQKRFSREYNLGEHEKKCGFLSDDERRKFLTDQSIAFED